MPPPPPPTDDERSDSEPADLFLEDLEVVSQTPDHLRVLLIEDDPDHAALAAAYLADVQDPAVELRHTETVEAGLDALVQARDAGEPFHAVLADQQLPDSAYWETVGRVVEVAGAVPVVALTSLGDLDVALDAVRSGATDYLVKGELTPELLRRTLRYAVERARRDEALRVTNEALRQTIRHVRQMQAQIVEQEKLAGLGRLLSGIAHELRNPLGLAVNSAEAAQTEAEALAGLLPDLDGDAAEHLAALLDSTQRAARNGRRADDVVQSMYGHARGVAGDVRTVSLADSVRVAATQTRVEDVRLEVDVRADTDIVGTASALTRLFANLLENAVRAAQSAGADGRVRVTLDRQDGENGPEAVVTVEDNGPGMDPAVAGSAFEPFESAWPGNRRVGLGLTVARAVAVGHGGRVEIRPAETGGTLVRVALPA